MKKINYQEQMLNNTYDLLSRLAVTPTNQREKQLLLDKAKKRGTPLKRRVKNSWPRGKSHSWWVSFQKV